MTLLQTALLPANKKTSLSSTKHRCMKAEKKIFTQTRKQLDSALDQAVRWPHKHFHKGQLRLHPDVFTSPDRETNVAISKFALLDCTGSIEVGPWCCFSPRSRIYTHDHFHMGRKPLLQVHEQNGVVWQDKKIGADVWIHDGAMVLYQVTEIPDGFILGAGSILTKNPGPYEIWVGSPARKLATRDELSEKELSQAIHTAGANPYQLPEL